MNDASFTHGVIAHASPPQRYCRHSIVSSSSGSASRPATTIPVDSRRASSRRRGRTTRGGCSSALIDSRARTEYDAAPVTVAVVADAPGPATGRAPPFESSHGRFVTSNARATEPISADRAAKTRSAGRTLSVQKRAGESTSPSERSEAPRDDCARETVIASCFLGISHDVRSSRSEKGRQSEEQMSKARRNWSLGQRPGRLRPHTHITVATDSTAESGRRRHPRTFGHSNETKTHVISMTVETRMRLLRSTPAAARDGSRARSPTPLTTSVVRRL